jgi:CRISPR-associated endonuclease/helicase Cas3
MARGDHDLSPLGIAAAQQSQSFCTAVLVAHAIAGHHAGLPDRIGDASSLNERVQGADLICLDQAWSTELTFEADNLAPAFAFNSKINGAFRLAFLGRMLFSCLVDADFKDTEAFYNRVEGTTADREWPELRAILPGFIERANAELATKAALGGETPVNRLRQRALAHVRSKAAEAPGLFTLTVPTGGGKTLTSLAFALDHARTHGMRRILYAIPFTSVIDQTAEIFRALFGPMWCLSTIPPSTRKRSRRGRASKRCDLRWKRKSTGSKLTCRENFCPRPRRRPRSPSVFVLLRPALRETRPLELLPRLDRHLCRQVR